MGCNHFPKCWTIKQYDEFKAKNDFFIMHRWQDWMFCLQYNKASKLFEGMDCVLHNVLWRNSRIAVDVIKKESM